MCCIFGAVNDVRDSHVTLSRQESVEVLPYRIDINTEYTKKTGWIAMFINHSCCVEKFDKSSKITKKINALSISIFGVEDMIPEKFSMLAKNVKFCLGYLNNGVFKEFKLQELWVEEIRDKNITDFVLTNGSANKIIEEDFEIKVFSDREYNELVKTNILLINKKLNGK